MTIETSYAEARQHLASLIDLAVEDRETISIIGPNGARVALIAADEVVPFDVSELWARLEQAAGECPLHAYVPT